MLRCHAASVLRVLAVSLSIIYLARLSWARWADPLIDFGQQLYLPWQVTEGKRLYGDLAYYNGPLSVWVNAAAFRIFGIGLWTIIGCNAVVLAIIIGLLHWLFRGTSSAWSALLTTLVFVWLFAFGKYVDNSNYNYLCPYNHEMTHGLCLALAMLAILWQGVLTRLYVAPIAGTLLGLVLLTKAEMSLAATATSLALWVMSYASHPRARWPALTARLALFGACAALPAVGAFLHLASCLPFKQAWTGTIGSWAVAATPEIRQLHFYRAGMGMANLEGNLTSMMLGCLVYVFFLAINAAGAYALASASARWRFAAITIIGLGFAISLAEYSPMIEVFHPVPLVLLGILGWLVIAWRNARNDATRQLAERRITLVMFAGALLLKMALATRIGHYGFVLAMPAALVVCAAFTSWIPTAFSCRGLFGGCLAGSSTVLVIFCIVLAQGVHHKYYLRPANRIASGADYFVSESPQAETVARMAKALASNTRPEDHVLVFPEGVMLNYVSRRETGIPYTNFMPPETLFFGESNMLAAMKSRPPDWIVIAPKNLADYDVRLGQGFLDEMVKWIDGHYDEEMRLQAPNGYFMVLLRHRSGLEDGTIGTVSKDFWHLSDGLHLQPLKD